MINQINEGLKHLLITLCAVVIAALTLATGYVPAAGLTTIIWKFAVVPVLAGIIAFCYSVIQHNTEA
jgi:hypothetical protein